MAFKKYHALMAYFGSKIKIVPYIFQHLPKPKKGETIKFLDPFMGGGSVSMYAKQLGYEVTGGDISYRASITGQALIANDKEQIPPLPVLMAAKKYERFVHEHYGDRFFFTVTETLDRLREGIKKRGDKPIEMMLYMKLLTYYMPFGMLIRKIPPPPEGYPFKVVRRQIDNINHGVFSNGKNNKFIHAPAWEVIDKHGQDADIVYLDPPYPGTLSYEESDWIDKCLFRDQDFVQAFGTEWTDKNKFLDTYRTTIEKTKHIPNYIMSIGNWDPEELLSILREYRPKAELFSIKHNWLRSLSKKDRGDELMLIDLEAWYDG